MKPHKHAELIKAWADGAVIEAYKPDTETWYLEHPLEWNSFRAYRIKPEPKPDVVLYFGLGLNFESSGEYVVYSNTPWGCRQPTKKCNLKITWDGETGKLKGAEVLK